MSALVAAAAIAVSLSPAVARPDAQLRVEVTGLHASSALVVLHGGIATRGKWFHWVPLRHAGGDTWTTVLQTPGLYGIYPLRLRVGRNVLTTSATVQIVPPGFARQPGFETPQQVAQWWAWIAQPGVVIKSMTMWHAGFFTHRDPSLNQLWRVEFNLLGNWPSLHLRRGPNVLYLSVARESAGAPWRLLQTVAAP